MTNRSLVACVCVAALIVASALAQEAKMILKTGRPGNLFAFGEKVAVQVEAKSVEWRVVDLDGAEVAKGKGAIEIANLPHGYYELTAKAGESTAKLPFGVVSEHSATPPPSGRLNVDGATAWLERQGRHEAIAQMLRMTGIGWVRERFSWAGTEPEKGKVDWKQYDATADAFAKQGVRVYQIFHDSPAWSHGGRKNTRNPADLRDAYAFAKRLAEHYKGRVQAWEVWNEPDMSPPPLAAAARPRRRAGLWVATVAVLAAVAAVVVLFLLPGSASPASATERSAASLQRACERKDSQAATALMHPAVRASYGKMLKDHEAELPRLGRLLSTRKLLAATDEVAEYEVTEDGETFILTFERHGNEWLLVGM